MNAYKNEQKNLQNYISRIEGWYINVTCKEKLSNRQIVPRWINNWKTSSEKHLLGTGYDDSFLIGLHDVGDMHRDSFLVLVHHGTERRVWLIHRQLVTGHGDAPLEGHDAPSIQHLRAGLLVLFKYVRYVCVVVARRAPSEHSSEIVARSQRQNSDSTLLLWINIECLNSQSADVSDELENVFVNKKCAVQGLHSHSSDLPIAKSTLRN